LRLIDFVYHSTLDLRVIKKKKGWGLQVSGEDFVFLIISRFVSRDVEFGV